MRIGQATLEHLRTNVVYPATGEQIKSAGNMMADIPLAERLNNIERIRSRTLYLSAADVISDLLSVAEQSPLADHGRAGPYVRFSIPQLSKP
jgi:hypothetical protein